MDKLSYRDPLFQNALDDMRVAVKGTDRDEHAARVETGRYTEEERKKIQCAAYYIAEAERLLEAGDMAGAAFQFHFAGHLFRMIGSEAKAAEVYDRSAHAGEQAIELQQLSSDTASSDLRAFNLRSIGRAALLYHASGQFEEAERAWSFREGLTGTSQQRHNRRRRWFFWRD